jgi:hypothetical protein
MRPRIHHPTDPSLPSLHDLGDDLLTVTPIRRVLTLAAPFAWIAGYFAFAALHCWALAILKRDGVELYIVRVDFTRSGAPHATTDSADE